VKFKVVENFWENFYDLRPEQKESVRRAWDIFRVDPFDPRLRTHRVHKLSARFRTTIYSAVIEADLRVIFRVDGETVTTLDVGTHAIYK
jgi:mRNA-degrading endonuclease YafQ of YafQ-DinJ toxin-antitoxin module